MGKKVGLWIDHREAYILILDDTGEHLEHMESDIGRHTRSSGGSRSTELYGPQDANPEDKRERKFQSELRHFYAAVAESLRGAGSVLLFGPGEAKGELETYLNEDKEDCFTLKVETADKMTENQIVAKVKKYFAGDLV